MELQQRLAFLLSRSYVSRSMHMNSGRMCQRVCTQQAFTSQQASGCQACSVLDGTYHTEHMCARACDGPVSAAVDNDIAEHATNSLYIILTTTHETRVLFVC
jgi:hypothetical protein